MSILSIWNICRAVTGRRISLVITDEIVLEFTHLVIEFARLDGRHQLSGQNVSELFQVQD
jgi:hypothetical protein